MKLSRIENNEDKVEREREREREMETGFVNCHQIGRQLFENERRIHNTENTRAPGFGTL